MRLHLALAPRQVDQVQPAAAHRPADLIDALHRQDDVSEGARGARVHVSRALGPARAPGAEEREGLGSVGDRGTCSILQEMPNLFSVKSIHLSDIRLIIGFGYG
jgi:hypothetical protein